jgi:hypothetical protein
MNWPFVSQARFADREREVLELRRELRETREHFERILDEINFRSSGFHLYARYERPADPVTVEAKKEPELEPTGVAAAIRAVGTRGTAIRQYMEAEAMGNISLEEKRIAEDRERQRQLKVAAMMEEVLTSGKNKASSQA